ncbi:hypothetical protein LINGRAHAP2_LOCUS23851 [Linum grandiflorum]
MPPSLFHRIMADVIQRDSYFKQRRDAAGRNSFSPQQKLTSSLRMLAYGCSADSLDEYCRMGSNNDINTLGVSPLFDEAVRGFLPKVSYEVNGTMYNQCYYLADGIYPSWLHL